MKYIILDQKGNYFLHYTSMLCTSTNKDLATTIASYELANSICQLLNVKTNSKWMLDEI